MNPITSTICATAMSITPALAGLSPETFASQLTTVMRADAMGIETASGKISSISSDKMSFVLKGEGDKTSTIRINDKTVFTLDGQTADRDKALQAGRQATVTHEKGVASRVEVKSEK
jgi:hypothetical protein